MEKKYLSEMPDLLKEWDFEQNKGIDVSNVSYGSIKKYYWICSKGHKWSASMNQRAGKKTGCPICANKAVCKGINDLATTNPELAEEWDWNKNKGITPAMFTAGSGKKVWWSCRKHGHLWQASISKRVNGRGCPVCLGKKVLIGFNDLATAHLELAEEWDYTKNTFSPYEVTAGANKKAFWICKKCGYQWDAVIASRAKGAGCPKCAMRMRIEKAEERAISNSNTLEDCLPEISKEWHSTKNGELKPKMVAPHSQKKVWWKCSNCGFEWKSIISNRAKGRGCPGCNYSRQSSLAEQIVYQYVKKQFPGAVRGYVCNGIYPYKVDVFIPAYKLGIEYDGERWHREVVKDMEKDHVLFENGFKVIRIREKGCPTIDDGCYVVNTCQPDYEEYGYLLEVIEELGQLLEEVTGVKCQPIDNLSLIKSDVAKSYFDDLRTKSLASCMPNLIEEWDFKANGNLKPEMLYPKSNKKVHWICKKCGYKWTAQICNRTAGTGCPCCAGKKIVEGYNDLKSQYPLLMKEWNYEKNNGIEPAQLTSGNCNTVVWWKCNKCEHEWKASVYNRARLHSGCPKCVYRTKGIIVGKKLSKKVVCITTGEHFDSQASAAKAYGTGKSDIGKCCKGKRLSSGKLDDGTRLRWAYVE